MFYLTMIWARDKLIGISQIHSFHLCNCDRQAIDAFLQPLMGWMCQIESTRKEWTHQMNRIWFNIIILQLGSFETNCLRSDEAVCSALRSFLHFLLLIAPVLRSIMGWPSKLLNPVFNCFATISFMDALRTRPPTLISVSPFVPEEVTSATSLRTLNIRAAWLLGACGCGTPACPKIWNKQRSYHDPRYGSPVLGVHVNLQPTSKPRVPWWAQQWKPSTPWISRRACRAAAWSPRDRLEWTDLECNHGGQIVWYHSHEFPI